MTDPGDDSAPGPVPDRPSWDLRVAGFVLSVLGIVLVAITPNPPVSLQDWLQIVLGASITAAFTTYAGWHEVVRLRLRGHGTRLVRWLSRRRVAVLVAVALALVLGFGIPPAWDFARGVSIEIAGCSPATQLRMVAGPETVTTARQLATAYERWTATTNHGCPTADFYVYSGPAETIRDTITADRWTDESDALREIGPRPDVWLAATAHELGGLAAPAVESTPFARSPVVLAVPEAVAQREAQRSRWGDLFRRLTDQGVGVVRADPGATELGLLATALLYGGPGEDGSAELAPPEIERRLAASLDNGGFPLTDTAGLLCRRRVLGSQVAVIASEQHVARFNAGVPLGTSCPSHGNGADRLVALYPSDTRDLDHQLVRLAWSPPPQRQAAAEFDAWLRSDAGREAIVRTGLRPVGPYAVGLGLTTAGIDPGAAPSADTMPPAEWDRARAAYDHAQRRGRVLFAVDTSGSMAEPTPEGTRLIVAATAVSAALRGMGPRDEFGLWFFPDPPGTGHVQAMPLGPPEYARLIAARQALVAARTAGNTPLFRTMIDAAAALGPDDPARLDAVVVLTDGQDTSSGVGADAVTAALKDSGVRLIVVTIGQARCSDPGLAAVTTTSAGDCFDADVSNLDTVLGTATAGLWGGR